MSNFVANEVVGKLKDYPLIKLLLKSLPNILVSLYAWSVFTSFSGLPWVKYTADSLGIKVISESLNLLGIDMLVGPVNNFMSWVKGGHEIWISVIIVFILISSTNFYLRESTRYIKDYNPENKHSVKQLVIVHMSNPANPVYALVFSFSAAIDWLRIIGFNWIFFVCLIVPLIMIVRTILPFVKSGKSGAGNMDNKVPILLVLGEVFFPIFIASLLYTPVLLLLLFTGNIDAERSK
ncbi:hypothetical protein [uncultured Rothia sp.]|uniref:hypothetical protein n=1 Tax=uncultured Rothia sp. TaxID=316088 RepID=UPI0025DEBFDA|nr:hypothetical protein [uncultured Rothia sp.]